jgi:hypothetical protein
MITGQEAKKALFVRLDVKTAIGQPLEGVTVSEFPPGEFGRECIYGGGRRYDHADLVAEGPGIQVQVTTTQLLYIRVMNSGPDSDVDVDARAEALAQIVAKLLKDEPNLGGGVGWQGIAGGYGDHYNTGDDQVAEVSMSVLLGRRITYD